MTQDTPATTDGESILHVAGLSAGYGPGDPILVGVDFDVLRGERVFVCGSNGSGKSCLLRTLAGRIAPRAGQVLRHVAAKSNRRGRVEHAFGYVPQSFELEPGLPITVGEFVSLGTMGLGLDRRERHARLDAALESMGLGGLRRRGFAQLSGGERQRTLVARALTRGAELLFLDEPTASLDPRGEHELHHWLDALVQERGLTLVCVSHALGIARAHADRIAIVGSGRVELHDVDAAFTSTAMQRAMGFDCAAIAAPSRG